VHSAPGRGSTFRVYLPRVECVERATPSRRSAETLRDGVETILLVEDDKAVRTMAAAVLRRAGYSVIEATNGVEGVRVCEDAKVTFDLVITDMVMPGMSGRALAARVREVRPTVPVLLMSGYTRDAMLLNAEPSLQAAFIEKPFTPQSFTQKVRELLERGPLAARMTPPTPAVVQAAS
jgi:two-component system, cell cycle sensor histidine kinase and response regulator CckA